MICVVVVNVGAGRTAVTPTSATRPPTAVVLSPEVALSLPPTLFICVVSTSREKEPPLSRARATFYLQRFVAPTRVGDVCLEFSSQQSLLLCFPIVAELMIASLSALKHFPDPNVLQGSMASPSLLLLPSPDL